MKTYLAAILLDANDPETYVTGFGLTPEAARAAVMDVLVSSYDQDVQEAHRIACLAVIVLLPAA